MNFIQFILTLMVLFTSCTSSDVPKSAEDVHPLEVGETIPRVHLVNSSGQETDLRNLISEKPALLIFYRGGWCPYCNAHLSKLVEIEEELYNLGIQIIAISPDQPSYLNESTAEHELGYRLLSDSKMDASKKFGLAYKVDPETVTRYKENNMDLAARSGSDHSLLPVPAAFLIDTGGIIHYRYFNPDYKVRVENSELLRVSRELSRIQGDTR